MSKPTINTAITFELIVEFLQKKLYLAGKPQLSFQEEIIIQGLVQQKTYTKIAETLYLNPGTIRNIASNLYRRLSQLLSCQLSKSNFLAHIQTLTLDSRHAREEFNDPKVLDVVTPSDAQQPVILLIDDQLDNLLLLKKILSKKNYKIHTVKSGKTALTLIDNLKPDLILLDILMPEMDGYAVCKALKSNDKYQHIPIIILSAIYDVVDKVKAFKLGACDYITKPFEDIEILARIAHHLQLQAKHQALQAEIIAHQETIVALNQSRSILANLLNHTPYGIAALEAIRDSDQGNVIDFRFILVNPTFTQMFPFIKRQLQKLQCTTFCQHYHLDWLPALIRIITDGDSFQIQSTINQQTVEVQGVKMGDGISLTVIPQNIDHWRSPGEIKARNRSSNN
ncbi:MAG: hypothetical protein RLZZ490_2582 [Cyanobacteriota bacterium]|jgi:DNA-binding response OmpR family regulator/DNA-binding CsgD family transcriptional regulator